jgi:hypothetical protein
MSGLFSQIGMGFDLQAGVAFVFTLAIWVAGLIPGLIGWTLVRRSDSRSRRVSAILGIATLATAVVLWGLSILIHAMWGIGFWLAQFVTLFALANTCVAVRILFFPARDRVGGAGSVP